MYVIKKASSIKISLNNLPLMKLLRRPLKMTYYEVSYDPISAKECFWTAMKCVFN